MAAPKIIDLSQSGGAPVSPALGKDPALLQRARNVMMQGEWAGRRRKGYRITKQISTSANSNVLTALAEHVFTGTGGSRFRFYRTGTSLYYHAPSTALSSTAGFTAYEPTHFVPWNDSLIVWTPSKRVACWNNAGTITVDDLHMTAPVGGAAAAAGAGTALPPGTYTYYLVAENSSRGAQSGPGTAFTVTLAAANNVSITTIPAIAGQVTGHKIYRTEPNGVVAKYVATTSATSYTDSTVPSALSSTDILPRDVYGTPFTSQPPSPHTTTNGGMCLTLYNGMLVTAGSRVGGALGYPKRIYFTSPGYLDRWSDNYYVDIPCKGNITAMCVQNGVLIVATAYDMWSVYGRGNFTQGPGPLNDFVIQNISHHHGVPNSTSLLALPNFAVGISTCGPIAIRPSEMGAGAIVALRVPDMDKYVVPRENYPQGCIGYNPRRREIWFALPVRGESNTDENRRVLVYSIDNLNQVSDYDLRISGFMQTPGINAFDSVDYPGYDMHFADWMGNCCQAEYGDGDGNEGDEVWIALGETVSIIDTGNTRITPEPNKVAFPVSTQYPGSNGLRGVRVVAIPASGTQEPEVRTVVTNTQTQFTVDEAFTNIAAGDRFFLAGILDDRVTGKMYLTAEEGRLARSLVTKTQCFWSDVVTDETA